MNAQTTALAVAEPVRRQAPQVRVVADPIPVLDTARFEHMQRIAMVMARSNLIPDTLCFEKDGDKKVPLELEMVTANCFLVVNQAVRWNMDPFAVAQCVSVVHGKLCYEGKLIAAVLEGKLGVELEYEISGEGEAMKVVVTGTVNGKPVLDSKGNPKIVEGTVGEWKTDGRGSPWGAKGGYRRMLRYRGAREWGRIHSPGLMLGVYGDDEMEDLQTRFITRAIDDGGGPPNPANDDGGGPPVPTEGGTSAAEDDGGGPPVPEVEILSHPDNGEGDARDRAEQVKEALPADDGLDIPDYLRVANTDKPNFSDDEKDWFEELENAFSSCESVDTLNKEKDKRMMPYEGSLPTQAWNRACEILDEHIERINAAG